MPATNPQMDEHQAGLLATFNETQAIAQKAIDRFYRAEMVQDAFHAWAEPLMEAVNAEPEGRGYELTDQQVDKLIQLVTASNLARGLRQ